MPVAQLQPKDFIKQVPESTAYSEKASPEDTRWLATNHYENFHVVSFLLPKHLHQDFYNVYAFCRRANDLGDEIGDTTESLRLLLWWREELEQCTGTKYRTPSSWRYEARCTVGIFPSIRLTGSSALSSKIKLSRGIRPSMMFSLIARIRLTPLATWSCTSVGTATRNASNYQTRLARGCSCRILAGRDRRPPKGPCVSAFDLLHRHGYTIEELFALKFNYNFEGLMREAVTTAEDCFRKGLPVIPQVDRRLAPELELFSRGGLRILSEIRSEGYNVLERRPHISKTERIGILLKCLPRLLPF
jgi:Squalene/phytoene synthase